MNLVGQLAAAPPMRVAGASMAVVPIMMMALVAELSQPFGAAWCLCFAISALFFLPATAFLLSFLRQARLKCVDAQNRRLLHWIIPAALGMWLAFPVLWLSACVGLVPGDWEQLLWPLLDNTCKLSVAAAALVIAGDLARAELSFETELRIEVLEAEKAAAEASNSAKRVFMR